MQNKHNRVFITGGASGLGAALALEYAKRNYRVCIGDRNLDGGQEQLALLKQHTDEAEFIECDVTQRTDLERAATHLKTLWGGCDILINNAGVAGTAGPIELVNEQDWQTVLDINVMGVVRGCQAFIPDMKKNNSGSIINIASAAGLMNAPMMSNYNASKSAVVSISETLKTELASSNINVSVCCPSFFKTALTKTLKSHIDGVVESVDKLMARSALTAEDVARDIVEQSEQGKFWIVPHKAERRLWLFKRLMPNYFHQMMIKRAAKLFRVKPSK